MQSATSAAAASRCLQICVAVASVALAWILHQGKDLVPLVGMGRPENVDRNLEAMLVSLDGADLAELNAAFPIGCAAGNRYPDQAMASVGREAPPAA